MRTHHWNQLRIHGSRFLEIFAVAALLLAAASERLSAQRSLPFSDDALVLGFGQVRPGIHGTWQFYDQVYGHDGNLVPYGSGLSYGAAGSKEFPSLAGNEAAIRSVSGQSALNLSFGATDVSATHRSGSTSLLLDIGLPGRLMISAEVPFVRVETTVGIRANAGGNSANVGLNPAATSSAAFATDTSLANQITRARNTLNSQLATCLGSSAPECTSLNARRAEAQTLASTSATVSAGLMGIASSPFAPLASSAIFTAITARVAAIANAYRDFGITTISGTSITPANLPLTAAQFRNFLASSAGGEGSLPSHRSLTRLGDINVSAKFRIVDKEQMRAAAFGRIHFPTGGKPSFAELLPLAAGEGATRTEFGGIADLFFRDRLSLTASGAGIVWLANDVNTRLVLPGSTGPGGGTVARRNSRNGLSLSITPRYSLNRWATIGAQFQTQRMSEETITHETAGTITTWNQQKAILDNRIGAGFSFSNLSASRTAGPRFPVEASFFHMQSISGSGLQPKIFSDEFRIRIFARK